MNRDFAIDVAEVAKEADVKQFIIMSSMSVYGIKTGLIAKGTKANPKSHYGRSKLQADRAIWNKSSDGFKVALLRPPMVYGKGCKGNYQSLRSFALKFPVFPNYKNKRSMIYIGNLCEFVKKTIDEQKFGLFFPQNADYTNTSTMVKTIAECNKKRIVLTSVFNWAIRIVPINVVKKVFGDLVYEQVDTVDKFGLMESIKLTEEIKMMDSTNDINSNRGVSYPKYSVLMPLFYKENMEYLRNSLESMMCQTLRPDEIVLIEDHPVSCEMKSLIEKLASKHKIKTEIYSNYDLDGKGLAAVLAYGVTKCKNDYVARMDTDDISLPERCEKEIALLAKESKLAIVGAWVDEFYGSTDNIITVRTTPEDMSGINNRFKYTNPFNHPSVMFKKDAIVTSGNYDVNSIADEDYDLWYRVIKKGYTGYNLQESLVKFRLGENFKKRRRNKKAFLAKTGIKKQMYMDGFMNVGEFFVTNMMEYVYLYCPFDFRRLLFMRDRRHKKGGR